ncbi:uncharacterized protein LOC123308375 isoform X2 [Coccinella septempunctata]|uniref:uncharacterized protein LOC123308375 isoform X2 n=1 Tax=Coccinella septempunctata TaxID=41139 RepID=UPI001D05CD82|nr:uncharacterized protein LOC123308375 isoform X2 [Coccinella septempunctata]
MVKGRKRNMRRHTLKTICDLMNGELSSQILVYLLTMVDMPKEGGCQLPIMEKMQKTHGCLAESVRPHLLECLKNKKQEYDESGTIMDKNKSTVQEKKTEDKKDSKCLKKENTIIKSSSDDDFTTKSMKRPKRASKGTIKKTQNSHIEERNDPKIVESLAQMSANYCTRYEVELREMYKTKLNTAWDMLYKKLLDKPTMNKIYEVIKYLNRMMKLVRMVENNEVTMEIIKEEYPDIEILARIRHQQEFTNPFDKIDRCLKKLRRE